jgi:hypothetical protein
VALPVAQEVVLSKPAPAMVLPKGDMAAALEHFRRDMSAGLPPGMLNTQFDALVNGVFGVALNMVKAGSAECEKQVAALRKAEADIEEAHSRIMTAFSALNVLQERVEDHLSDCQAFLPKFVTSCKMLVLSSRSLDADGLEEWRIRMEQAEQFVPTLLSHVAQYQALVVELNCIEAMLKRSASTAREMKTFLQNTLIAPLLPSYSGSLSAAAADALHAHFLEAESSLQSLGELRGVVIEHLHSIVDPNELVRLLTQTERQMRIKGYGDAGLPVLNAIRRMLQLEEAEDKESMPLSEVQRSVLLMLTDGIEEPVDYSKHLGRFIGGSFRQDFTRRFPKVVLPSADADIKAELLQRHVTLDLRSRGRLQAIPTDKMDVRELFICFTYHGDAGKHHFVPTKRGYEIAKQFRAEELGPGK